MEKVYQVEFMTYTNSSRDIVCRSSTMVEKEYLEVGTAPFLIKECDLAKYRQYGGGFKSIKYVGNMDTTL